jgi:hypothetical protein
MITSVIVDHISNSISSHLLYFIRYCLLWCHTPMASVCLLNRSLWRSGLENQLSMATQYPWPKNRAISSNIFELTGPLPRESSRGILLNIDYNIPHITRFSIRQFKLFNSICLILRGCKPPKTTVPSLTLHTMGCTHSSAHHWGDLGFRF